MKTFVINAYKAENGYMSEAKCLVVSDTEENAIKQFYDYHHSLQGGGIIVNEVDLTKPVVQNVHISHEKLGKK